MALSTFVVNSIYDQPAADPTVGAETAGDAITLRSAIQAANAHPNDSSGPDRIEFDIPGSEVQTIVPFSLWPEVTDPIVIDGYTQPGARPNALDVGDDAVLKINLDDRFGFREGLTITAGNSTVRGLDITHFAEHGLTLTDKGGNVVSGNFFGMPPSGSPSLGNEVALYVGFGADGNIIGGTTPADRNVIAGNGTGLRIVASSNNVVQGNYFGLDISRSEPLGNGLASIIVTSGVAGETTGPATGNLIGGTVSGARNIISGSGAGIIFGGDQASMTSGNLVQGNYIGTDVLGGGNAHFSNFRQGVLLASGTGRTNPGGARLNTIGGSTAAARNVISNSVDGIAVETGATDNLIQGNYIGTDATGTVALQESITGISVQGSHTTVVGNLVSGNRVDGIFIQGGDESIIQGNLIGTNAAGNSSVQNQWGIHLSGSNHVTIGGTTASERNVISGNQRFGVSLEDSGVGNRIQGNFIGTDINGTGALGNGVNGIFINFSFTRSPSGDTLIGGPDAGAGNIIAFSGTNGVDIRNSSLPNATDGSVEANTIFSNALNGILVDTLSARDPHYRITRNSIFSNGGLGIDLGNDGVTPNDSRSHIAGPNSFQNFPLLTSVSVSDTAAHVSGTLKSTPNTTFRIEFFANEAADPSGHGEGQSFLGFTNVTTDASGNASFNNVALPPPPAGQTFVAATATDAIGNTSEFSGLVESTPLPASSDLSISMSSAPSPVSPGGTETYMITITNNGPDRAHTVSVTTSVPTSTTFVSFTSPSGWTASHPSVGGVGTVSSTIPELASGESASFTFDVQVSDGASNGTALTADGSVTSDTTDPDTNNNHASAQAVVSAPLEHTDLAITATAAPDPVGQGQVLTFTLIVTNNGQITGTNVLLSMETPSQTTFEATTVPTGWTTQTPSVGSTGIISASIGSIDAGATAVFTITTRVGSTATVASTIAGVASIVCETVDSNPDNNRAEASANVAVSTPPVGTPDPVPSPPVGTPDPVPSPPVGTPDPVPSPPVGSPDPVPSPPVGTPDPVPSPPSVVTAVRYGFHRQSTILVVSLGQEMSPADASNPQNYSVRGSTNGSENEVSISKVWYDPQSHQATLRVAQRIYLFHPWQLVVRGITSDLSRDAIGSGATGRSFVTKMDSHSLRGPSWDAPGASRVGIKAVPAGPLTAWARKVALAVRTQPARTHTIARTASATKALHARPLARPISQVTLLTRRYAVQDLE